MPALGGVGRNHAMTAIVEQQPGQQVSAYISYRGSGCPLLCQPLLAAIEWGAIHNRRLRAGQYLILVFDLTDIEAVTQQIEQRAAAEGNAATGRTCCQHSGLGAEILLPKLSHQRIDAAELKIAPVDQSDSFSLLLDDGNLVTVHAIAKGKCTANP